MKKHALILVDFQKDFFSSSGFLRKSHFNSNKATSLVEELLKHNRENYDSIVWVFSINQHDRYKDDSGFSLTSPGLRPFCLPNSVLSQPLNDIQKLIDAEKHIVLFKTNLSIFSKTALKAELRKKEIESIDICGVVYNRCFLESYKDAKKLGYNVKILANYCQTLDSEFMT